MALSHFKLTNKIALITGGGTGIGLGIASAFVDAGAKVIISGRRESVLKQACDDLGKNAFYKVMDLTEREKIPETINSIEQKIGPIDILVNNAGIHLKKAAQETSDEEFDRILNTNLAAVFSLTRECTRKMIQRKSGAILLISSMTAIFGVDRVVAYGTSKAALTGLMNNLTTEYAPHNIRINAIAPGWIESDMFLKAIDSDPERKQKIVNRIAMNGFGKPEDIGNAAIYLCSDAARYVTGVLLPVDGGAVVNF
jgi:NAD(P)-dependent dehydrogenase (short-subunit alcohol dehydrogenase family)